MYIWDDLTTCVAAAPAACCSALCNNNNNNNMVLGFVGNDAAAAVSSPISYDPYNKEQSNS
jgi:hypothetical protein